MMFPNLLAIFLLCICYLVTGQDNLQPAYDLVSRTLGSEAPSHFELVLLSSKETPCHNGSAIAPCFGLSDISGGKVRIEASSLSELTYGIGYYLRFYCAVTVGWPTGGGSYNPLANISTPDRWPVVGESFVLHRAVPFTWQDNVCTHSYSYVWYDQVCYFGNVDYINSFIYLYTYLNTISHLSNLFYRFY